jgi:glucose-1-phosphate thymidylyltransferase
MQGILLSGGLGSRLWPTTRATNKQLLLIYDKPLIYYPLTTAILSGIDHLVVVTTREALEPHKRLLGYGEKWKIRIDYAIQESPKGIPNAFGIARNLLNEREKVALFLGDNVFYGPGLGQQIFQNWLEKDAVIFGFEVANPKDFGVVVLDSKGEVKDLIEKPASNESNIAIPGIYGFPSDVFERAENLTESSRGETEIVELLRQYLLNESLDFRLLPRGAAWLDTGSPDGMLKASQFVNVLQDRQGLLIGSPDEAAWRVGRISNIDLKSNANEMSKSDYGQALLRLLSATQTQFKS